MTDTQFYDALEARSAEARESVLMAELATLVEHAREHAPYYGKTLADVDPGSFAHTRRHFAKQCNGSVGDVSAPRKAAGVVSQKFVSCFRWRQEAA